MELKEYRFDEVTINFDKKRVHFLARSAKKGKVIFAIMVHRE